MLVRLTLAACFLRAVYTEDAWCNPTAVQVHSRWLFSEGTSCKALMSQRQDRTRTDYRYECQWWLALTELPRDVAQVYVTECYDLTNGTTKYRVKLCCEGSVSGQFCVTCSGVEVQIDDQTGVAHTDRCNYYSGVVANCSANEVCMTVNDYGSNGVFNWTVTKSCAARTECENLARLSKEKTCAIIEAPRCVQCCTGPHCNRNVRMISIKPSGGDPCAVGDCWNGGTCVPDSSLVKGYRCQCPPGVQGTMCQTSSCTDDPCNNGECVITETTPFYRCSCGVGIGGSNCEEKRPACSNATYCLNGGVCFDHGDFGLRCKCPSGFIGTRCELMPRSCSNSTRSFRFSVIPIVDTTCTEQEEGLPGRLGERPFHQFCFYMMGRVFEEGVTGHVPRIESASIVDCSSGDDYTALKYNLCCPACYSAPCQHGGWCTQDGALYTCSCRAGFAGKHCEDVVAIVDGGLGQWSSWGQCSASCGAGQQTRTRSCDSPAPSGGGLDCSGHTAQVRPCQCVMRFRASVDCPRLGREAGGVWYVADTCNCSRYYECRQTASSWQAVRRVCPVCRQWRQTELSCIPKNTTDCNKGSTVPANHVIKARVVACISFDKGICGFQSSTWVYIQSLDVAIVPKQRVGRGSYFDGKAHLVIPRFTNSYSRFGQIAISFWYRRVGSGRGEQGLVTNDNNQVVPASISLVSTENAIAVRLLTDGGNVSLAGVPAVDGTWHHVVFSYDGNKSRLFVDRQEHFVGYISGHIRERYSPMTIGLTYKDKYFTGYMDELCFYEAALSARDVDALYNVN